MVGSIRSKLIGEGAEGGQKSGGNINPARMLAEVKYPDRETWDEKAGKTPRRKERRSTTNSVASHTSRIQRLHGHMEP